MVGGEENPFKKIDCRIYFLQSHFSNSIMKTFRFFSFSPIQELFLPFICLSPSLSLFPSLLSSFQAQFIFHLFPPLLIKILSSLNLKCIPDHDFQHHYLCWSVSCWLCQSSVLNHSCPLELPEELNADTWAPCQKFLFSWSLLQAGDGDFLKLPRRSQCAATVDNNNISPSGR